MIAALEKRVEVLSNELQQLNKQLGSVGKQVTSATSMVKEKRKTLISSIEDIFNEKGGGPLKVAEVKDILLNEIEFKTRAKNFYAVITVSMNVSKKFEKTAPGEYRLIPDKAVKGTKAPMSTGHKKKAVEKKNVTVKTPAAKNKTQTGIDRKTAIKATTQKSK